MEADWEVELTPEAPIIDASWTGLVDLRREPHRVHELPEVEALPALAHALLRLNAASSPVWTAKCDVWPLPEFDPDEMDAADEHPQHALACYVDLLPGSASWDTPPVAVAWCRALCHRLHAAPLHSCRADLIVRHACPAPGISGIGITAYLSACGQTPADAALALGAALAAFADAVSPATPPADAASRLQ